jgi:cyclic beta-1,2-glucan synthetase
MEEWSARVRDAVETHGWDGEWYRRAFFDDGTPIGSRDSPEARIDSIAQSWAVISGAGDPERARVALDSAWRLLVRPEDEIALLLTPPFTGEGANPGYIAAYPPGVRENGGQYTHAAAWLIRALARSGQGDRVGELLNLILPTRHAAGRGTQRYRVEPYVIAADVYGMDPHVGRGGWTWYTGSAGWVWRVVIEDVLGIRRRGDQLVIDPCLPPRWLGFEADLRLGEAEVHIRVQNPEGVSRGVASCTVNGEDADPSAISLSAAGPGVPIRVEATLGVSVSGGARV